MASSKIINASSESSLVTGAMVDSTWFKVTVGTTCSLSILGSLMIILSYCGFKGLRTMARLILVHLSIMDLGSAASNLIGLAVDFNRYYNENGSSLEPSASVKHACVAQGAFALYFTIGSFLWTMAMAVYIYLRIVHHKTPKVAHLCLWTSTVFCYAMPLFITLWELLTRRLGYTTSATEGWCGPKYIDEAGRRSILLAFIGYDMWLFLTYIIVPILYISVLLFLRQQLVKTTLFVTSERFWDAVHRLDFKLLLIPVAFLLLRVWSFVNVVIYVYLHVQASTTFLKINVYLAGIGDSSQGLLNVILFVMLTKKVRNKLFPCCQRVTCNCCQQSRLGEETPLIRGSLQDGRTITYDTPHLIPSLSSLTDSVRK